VSAGRQGPAGSLAAVSIAERPVGVRGDRSAGLEDVRGARGEGASTPTTAARGRLHRQTPVHRQAPVHRRHSAGDRRFLVGCATAVLAPFLIEFVGLVVSGTVHVAGDDALNELAISDAARGRLLVGPYSRYLWHHPGPVLAYLAVPFRAAMGAGRAQYGAAIALNAACAVAVLVVLQRRAGRRGAAVGAAVLALTACCLGAGFLQEPWNPYLVTIPLLAAAVFAADVVAGADSSLIGVVGFGSVAAQGHVATAPVVAGLGLVATAAVVRRGRAGAWRALAPAAALGALLWAAPVWQQLTGHPGNLGRLVSFSVDNAGHQPLTRGVGALLQGAWVLTGRHPSRSQGPSTPPPSAAVLLVVLNVVALGSIARSRDRLRRALVGVGITAEVGAVLGNTRITGPLYPYLTAWQVVAPLLLLLAIGLAVAARAVGAGSVPGAGGGRRGGGGRRPQDLLVVAGAVAAVALLATDVLGAAIAGPPRSTPGGAAVAGALGGPLAAGRGAILLGIPRIGDWPQAAGVAAELERRGWHVRLADDEWVPIFGASRRRTGTERLEVDVGPVAPQVGRRSVLDVARVGGLSIEVFELSDPGDQGRTLTRN